MKILVFGAGVLGCNLARNFFRAGKDVTLLARGAWGESIPKNGLRIKDEFSPRMSVSRIPVTAELKAEDQYDVIFVVLRYTQLDAILDTLRTNPTKNIVFVGNDVRASALSASLPEKNVMFAFASSAGHREREYVASIDLKKITIGQSRVPPPTKAHRADFHGTKYKVPTSRTWRIPLCHAAFVLPVAFACYKATATSRTQGQHGLLSRLIDDIEGYRAIRDAGHEILPKDDAEFEGAAYRKTCLRFFKLHVRHEPRKDLRVRPRDERGRRNERAEPRFEGLLRRARREISRVAGA